MSINRVTLVGRLTKDPELRHTQNAEVCRFTVACDRNRKDDGADFISCVAFGQSANYMHQYGSKGAMVAVDGRIQTGSYEKDGRKVYTTDVLSDRVELIQERRSSSSRSGVTGTTSEYTRDIADSIKDVEITDEDLPF